MRSAVLALVATCLLAPASSQGAGFKPWAAATGSWATYSMKDVNDQIGSINDALAGAGSSLTMDEINNGFGFGVAFGGDLSEAMTVGIGYDRVFGSSEVSDASGSIKFDFPANAFRGFGEYRFPSSGQFKPHVGIALGMVSASGTISATGLGSGDVTGSGPLAEVYVGGDMWAAPKFAITGSAGYRYAKIGEFKVDDETATNADDSKATMDYSGFTARLGLKVAFMQ
jgi:hypothetical protein